MRDADPCSSIRRGASHRTKVPPLLALGGAMALWLAVPSQATYAQQSYSDYYRQALRQTHGDLGTNGSDRYLYDKYFYHRPTVSPYVNLGRPDPPGSTSYQAYVQPELQRREAAMKTQSAYIQQRKLQGNVGETRYPGAGFIGGTPADAWLKPVPQGRATPSSYYNHWYGGWSQR